MSDKPGPWDLPEGQQGAPPPPVPRHRLWIWLALLGGVALLAGALAQTFPDAIRTTDDKAGLLYQLGLVVLVSTALLRGLRGSPGQHLKHAALWVGVVGVLVLGWTYRGELAQVGQRVRLAFNVGGPVQVAERTLVVPQGEDGGYVVDGLVNGQRVRFVVDTGATETVLSPDDGKRVGIPIGDLTYGYEAETANGTGYGAAYDTTRFEVGPIKLEGYRVMINKAPMSGSLLGMTFLRRLDSFEFGDRTLTLKWREDGKGRAY